MLVQANVHGLNLRIDTCQLFSTQSSSVPGPRCLQHSRPLLLASSHVGTSWRSMLPKAISWPTKGQYKSNLCHSSHSTLTMGQRVAHPPASAHGTNQGQVITMPQVRAVCWHILADMWPYCVCVFSSLRQHCFFYHSSRNRYVKHSARFSSPNTSQTIPCHQHEHPHMSHQI